MRGVVSVGVVLVLALACATARAQQPPKKLWTKFATTMPHANVAGQACQLQGRTVVEGRTRPIEIHAQEDNQVLCWSGQPNPDAVHAGVLMTNDPSRQTEVVIEVDVPDGASQQAIEDLRAALRSTEAELQKRTGPAPVQQQQQPQQQQQQPIVVVQQPPPVPMHPEQVTNWGLAGAGIGVFLGGYLLTALMGAAILDAHGDPGTQRFWPWVPGFGAIVFTTTYKDAPNCDCSTGRVFAVAGGIAIDAVQVAGLVMMIVGFSTTKTRMVPDTAGWHLRPNGTLEVRF